MTALEDEMAHRDRCDDCGHMRIDHSNTGCTMLWNDSGAPCVCESVFSEAPRVPKVPKIPEAASDTEETWAIGVKPHETPLCPTPPGRFLGERIEERPIEPEPGPRALPPHLPTSHFEIHRRFIGCVAAVNGPAAFCAAARLLGLEEDSALSAWLG